jgi:hypothetical protein
MTSPSVFASAKGPTASFNEAVQLVNGQRKVLLPPFANDDRIEVSRRTLPPLDGPDGKRTGTFAHAVYMVETQAGLVECAFPLPHERHCRPSTYGSIKLKRTWTVLRKGVWQNCSGPTADRTLNCKPFKPQVETLPGGKQVVWFGVLGIEPPVKVQ